MSSGLYSKYDSICQKKFYTTGTDLDNCKFFLVKILFFKSNLFQFIENVNIKNLRPDFFEKFRNLSGKHFREIFRRNRKKPRFSAIIAYFLYADILPKSSGAPPTFSDVPPTLSDVPLTSSAVPPTFSAVPPTSSAEPPTTSAEPRTTRATSPGISGEHLETENISPKTSDNYFRSRMFPRGSRGIIRGSRGFTCDRETFPAGSEIFPRIGKHLPATPGGIARDLRRGVCFERCVFQG